MALSQALPLHERPVQYLKGVGPARARLLAELGIASVEDAFLFPPRRYEDRRRLVAIQQAQPGETVTVRGSVVGKNIRRIRGGQSIVDITIGDGSGVLSALWFHQPYLAKQIELGQELLLYGKIEPGARRQMIHPELERIEGEGDATLDMGRIVPVYPLVAGLSQRWMRRLIWSILDAELAAGDDPLPLFLREKYSWPAWQAAVREMHFPSSLEAVDAALLRLAFDELIVLQAALAQRRAKTQATAKPQRYQVDGPLSQALQARLPFALTAAQKRVIQELLADLAKPSPMYRLLQGDVGCGKTIVVIALMAVAIQSGYQVALMVPTELLAEQHAQAVARYLGPLGVASCLLSQGVPAAERKRSMKAISEGAISVVVGTHALIQSGVQFKKLSLVIIDEQHKFGVVQRASLAKKAAVPDVLVLTATPIPRTLALSLYGDLAVSTIDELPPGRSPIDTIWIRESQRPELYEMIRHQLQAGRQGYIVYPLVNDKSTSELRAANQMAKHLQTDIFSEFRVGVLHGQLKPKEKERRMQLFAKGECQLLVSTVIVEVGIDVPNATIMVIEHPERFGLAQLHQLRGRIGRGRHPATCAVITNNEDEALGQRLEAFVRTTDGLQLAEYDLAQRGPGNLLGRFQHGWFRFRVADLSRDRSLLETARQEADSLVASDPELANPQLAGLRERLNRFRKQPG